MSEALHATADSYLAALAVGDDLPGGVMFRELLDGLCSDRSLDGLRAVDELLTGLREQGLGLDAMWDEPAFHNFVFCLGFHVAQVIVAETGQEVGYLSREELAERLPDLDGIEDLALVFALETVAGLHLPLLAIVALLRGTQGSVWLDAAGRVRDIRRAAGQIMDDPLFGDDTEIVGEVEFIGEVEVLDAGEEGTPGLHEVLAGYVAALTGDATIAGGIAYRDKIDAARLDGTVASLHYVDQILLRLHEHGARVATHGARGDFANLVRAFGAYSVQVTIAELGVGLAVLSDEGFRVTHPELAASIPQDLGSVFVLRGIRPGHVMFPLAAITSRIDLGSRASVHGAVTRQIALLQNDLAGGR